MISKSNDSKNQQLAEARRDFFQALTITFDTPAGQRILAWLHSTAATRKPCFLPGDLDPYAASFRDGRKSIIWEIEANLETARESYGATPAAQKPKTTGARSARRKTL